MNTCEILVTTSSCCMLLDGTYVITQGTISHKAHIVPNQTQLVALIF